MITAIRPFDSTLCRSIRGGLGLSAMLLFGVMSGCRGVLDVDSPGRISADRLDDPRFATILVNGALGEVECAWDNHNAGAAWLSDQYEPASGNFYLSNLAARRVGADDKMLNEGTCDTNEWIGTYMPLQIARAQAEDVLRRLQLWAVDGVVGLQPLEAKIRAYGGYAYLALGEGFESVAFGDSRILPPDSALARADEWFTAALSIASNDSIANLARVGRARTRLNRGDKTGAVADASLVPPGFRALVTRGVDANRRMNKVFVHQLGARIADRYLSLAVQGTADPRVPTAGPIRMNSGVMGYRTAKYASEAAPHRLASYKEAQYILAEAQGGQAAVDIINALRDSLLLPRFAGGTEAEILAEILEERAREFFAEGALRLNDLLRHNIAWKEGTAYGTTRRFPLPRNELEGIP